MLGAAASVLRCSSAAVRAPCFVAACAGQRRRGATAGRDAALQDTVAERIAMLKKQVGQERTAREKTENQIEVFTKSSQFTIMKKKLAARTQPNRPAKPEQGNTTQVRKQFPKVLIPPEKVEKYVERTHEKKAREKKKNAHITEIKKGSRQVARKGKSGALKRMSGEQNKLEIDIAKLKNQLKHAEGLSGKNVSRQWMQAAVGVGSHGKGKTGVVVAWNSEWGYGFIRGDGGENVFAHRAGIGRGGGSLIPGQNVSFEVELMPTGMLQAKEIYGDGVSPQGSTSPPPPPTSPPPPRSSAAWTAHYNEEHQQPYWHNEQTGETTWVRPGSPPPPTTPPPTRPDRQPPPPTTPPPDSRPPPPTTPPPDIKPPPPTTPPPTRPAQIRQAGAAPPAPPPAAGSRASPRRGPQGGQWPPREPWGGSFIMQSRNDTCADCLQYSVLGAPGGALRSLQRLQPGDPIFLYNVESKEVYGGMEVVQVGRGIEPHVTWASRFSAQVKFSVPAGGAPPVRDVRDIPRDIMDTVFGKYGELDAAQVQQLLAIFRGEAVPAGTVMGGSGTGRPSGGRAADWTCPACGVNVFGSKSECYQCGAPRPGGGAGPGGGIPVPTPWYTDAEGQKQEQEGSQTSVGTLF